MKIVQVVGWYYPRHSGGSEVYVRGLARELKAQGHEVLIAIPEDDGKERIYEFEGVQIYCYPVGSTYSQGESEGGIAPASANTLCAWIRSVRPDIVHFHSWTRGSGYWHLRKIHEAGFPVYLTVHTAAPFCTLGTMKRWGAIPCDGEVRPVRCSACYLQGRRIPKLSAMALSWLAVQTPWLKKILKGRLKTIWNLPSSQIRRQQELSDIWSRCTKVIAVCHWVYESLSANGCPREKLVLMRQGCNQPGDQPRKNYQVHHPLRIGFLGRLDYVKGVRILVEAFKHLSPTDQALLELKGIPCDDKYLKGLHRLINNDSRIQLLQPSPPDQVRDWLLSLDVMVVPSRWLETGPLVIYEAFAIGLPVIGVRQGGIAELIDHEVNGLLFDGPSVSDLAKVLKRIVNQPSILQCLHQNIAIPRSMREVGVEMTSLYEHSKNS